MRKRSVLVLIALAALVVAIPTRAQMSDESGSKWTIHGEARVRADYFENYDFVDTDPAGGFNDNGGIWPYTIRVGIDGQITDNVKAMVEFRNDATFGSSPTFNEFGGDPMFFSGAYSSEDNVNLYQGYIQLDKLFGLDHFSARIGRQEHTYGTELLMGDNDFYTGQAFDGVRLMWLHDRWDLNAFYYKLAENNNDLFSPVPAFVPGSSDTNFMGATFDWKFEDKLGTVGVYFLRYQELANAATTQFGTLFDDAGLDTIGVRWGKMPADEGMFDWNVEYAAQTGDAGNAAASRDFGGDVIEGWFGVNFHPGNSHHRINVGYLNASGDDGSVDDNVFHPLFNDGHAHNRLGNLDNLAVSDIEDISLAYTGRFRDDKHTIMLAVHSLTLDQPVPISVTDTSDDIGMAWDLNYVYAMNKNVAFEFNVSQLQPGDVQDANLAPSGSADTASRYYGQVHVRW